MMTKDADLIEQYTLIHKSKKYGVTGRNHANRISDLIIAEDIHSWLDYGCGQSQLTAHLVAKFNGKLRADRYDPAIPDIDVVPGGPYDLVTCTDVLEHIREGTVPAVVHEVSILTRMVAYFAIALRPAIEILPNGENAHVTVKPAEWWKELLQLSFPEVTMVNHMRNHEATFICYQ